MLSWKPSKACAPGNDDARLGEKLIDLVGERRRLAGIGLGRRLALTSHDKLQRKPRGDCDDEKAGAGDNAELRPDGVSNRDEEIECERDRQRHQREAAEYCRQNQYPGCVLSAFNNAMLHRKRYQKADRKHQ